MPASVGPEAATVDFYDGLADGYTTQFADWRASQDRQAGVIARFLRTVCPDGTGSILDTACGVGTQAIGLARLGYRVHATDLSPASIEQAKQHAEAAGV